MRSDREMLVDAVLELKVLVPALIDALESDSGTSEGERVTATSEMSLPFNADVVHARMQLNRGFLGAIGYVCETLGEPPVARTAEGALNHAERLYDRLTTLGHTLVAAELVSAVCEALNTVRYALGMLPRDRQVGSNCPFHDERLTGLVSPGPSARVVWERGAATVRADHVPMIMCRHCDSAWMPSQYIALGADVAAADARRAE